MVDAYYRKQQPTLATTLNAGRCLQAMIEGLGILLTRTTAPPPAPVMMPEMGSAGPSAPGSLAHLVLVSVPNAHPA